MCTAHNNIVFYNNIVIMRTGSYTIIYNHVASKINIIIK